MAADPRPDPFDQLLITPTPEAPRFAFAVALLARLEHELGVVPSTPATPVVSQGTAMPKIPVGFHAVNAYLCAKGAADAIAFYVETFGAREVAERYIDQTDGRIGHAEFEIGDTRLMISDEYPDMGVLSPTSLGGSSIALNVYVDDVDDVYARALASGATGLREPADQFYGERSGAILDPWGHRWSLHSMIEDRAVPAIEGFDLVPSGASAEGSIETPAMTDRAYDLLHGPAQLGYFTMRVGDLGRARAFFGSLFGWQIEDGHEGGGHIANIDPPGGLNSLPGDEAVVLYFQVPDVASAAERVRALGGTVRLVTDYDSGGNAECTDDQGTRFDLFQPIAGYERQ